MATRLERFLSHGSISNTEPGKVTGTLWFIDADDPVTLELEGNPHRDLAGTVLIFEHADPELSEGETVPRIAPVQKGIAGDITASKKVFHHESILDNPDAHEPSLVNSLCIEWYNEAGERFVIDSIEFYLYAGEAEWQMDAAAEKAQLKANTRRFHSYIEAIANRISDDDELDEDDEPPLNEFEWEERLKESDRITQAYMEALDKYQDLPNQEQLVAAAMGWNQSAEDTGNWNAPAFDDDEEEDEDDDEYVDDPWLGVDPREDENHPLYERAHEFSVRLHRDSQEMGVLDIDDGSEGGDVLTPVQTLVFSCMELSAKLAGALNGITAQSDPEPGLIVAWLKRGLPILGRALGAAESALAQDAAPREWVENARGELFELRAAILDLIHEFRSQLP